MATYLQGVTPYIPQIQPFQEDLNFYANVLQTKQQQYDSNYKKLNQVYGQYFYADLTRKGNIEKKEELLNNINFNLQRVAGLDLSLDQNINQAVQVFKPFYEDKYLMKDMAWTKNYNREKGFAEGLRRSSDEKRSSQYWDTGIKFLDYKKLEFAESSDEDSLNFGSVRYTPYTNVTKEAMAIAKEANLSIDSIDFSPDGKWLIKTRNGQALTEPLSKLFEATLANDPRVQDMYQTQAYVNRKDYAYGNAGQFNGDVKAAEMNYLEESFNMFKEQNQIQKKQLEQTSTAYDQKIKDIENQIANGTANPQAKLYLEQLKSNKQINDSSLSRVSALDEKYQEISSTLSTSTGYQNAFGDIESLRNKVDAGMAASLLQKDLGEAAQIFAYRNSSVDITANPYAVNEQKHMFSMQEIAARNAGLERAARIRNQGERKNLLDTELLKTGDYKMVEKPIYDEAGNMVGVDYDVVPNENLEEVFTKPSGESSTPEINQYRLAENRGKETIQQNLIPYFQKTYDILSELKQKNQITDKEIRQILGGRGLEQFRNTYEKYPNHFSKNVLGAEGLNKLLSSIDGYMLDEGNMNLEAVKRNQDVYLEARQKAKTYNDFLKIDLDWRKKTSKQVESELYDQGFKYAKYLYDQSGRMRSEEEFYSMIPEKEKAKYSQITAKRGNSFVYRDEFGVSDPEIGVKSDVKRGALYDKELSYAEMKKAAALVYSDSDRIEAPPIVISGGKLGTGLGTDLQGVTVSPKSPWLKGTAHWNSFARDFRNLDLGSDNVRMSVTGFGTKSSSSELLGLDMDNIELNNLLGDMTNQLIADTKNTKSGVGNFDIFYSDIAEGSANRSAMQIIPDSKWLNDYLTRKKAAISEDDYRKILNGITTNGLSVVADRNQFNNTLKQTATMSPIEAIVNSTNSYSYTDPVTSSIFTVTKDLSGLNKYKYDMQFGIWDPSLNNGMGGYKLRSGESLGYNIGGDALPDITLNNFTSNLPYVRQFNETLR